MTNIFRDRLGRFARRPVTPVQVVPGRLYDYKGTVVRAKSLCHNGKRHVSFHKQLHGFVEDKDLKIIDRNRVKDYLAFAVRDGI